MQRIAFRLKVTSIHQYLHQYTNIYINTSISTLIHQYLHQYTNIYINTPIPTSIHQYLHQYTNIYINTPISTPIHKYLHQYINIYRRIYRYVQLKPQFKQIHFVCTYVIHIIMPVACNLMAEYRDIDMIVICVSNHKNEILCNLKKILITRSLITCIISQKNRSAGNVSIVK